MTSGVSHIIFALSNGMPQGMGAVVEQKFTYQFFNFMNPAERAGGTRMHSGSSLRRPLSNEK